MPRPSSPAGVTRRKADAHEALMLRLAPLLRQAESTASHYPRAAVPDTVRSLAEAVLFDARMFRSPAQREKMPAAAPHYGALAVQLGAALAELVTFENIHTQWDKALGAFVWLVPGATLPVRRLRPQVEHGPDAKENGEQQQVMAMLERRINAITKGLDDAPMTARTYPPRRLETQTYPRRSPLG